MTGSKGGNPENEELTPLINDKREKRVFLFYTIDIRTPLLTISIWQDKTKKKLLGERRGWGPGRV